MFKVIVAGSRDFDDYDKLALTLNRVLENKVSEGIEIVSGTARGADRLGEIYADNKRYSVAHFPADWDLHGKKAGFMRNEDMAKYADALVAFWDGWSKGTKHMIELAKKHKLKIVVMNYITNEIYRY